MIIISTLKTELLIKFVVPLFILSFGLLAIVPIIGVEVKGAKRWIDLTGGEGGTAEDDEDSTRCAESTSPTTDTKANHCCKNR